jgi:hypothetical protein
MNEPVAPLPSAEIDTAEPPIEPRGVVETQQVRDADGGVGTQTAVAGSIPAGAPNAEPTDPIVGHKTFFDTDGLHQVPLRHSEVYLPARAERASPQAAQPPALPELMELADKYASQSLGVLQTIARRNLETALRALSQERPNASVASGLSHETERSCEAVQRPPGETER